MTSDPDTILLEAEEGMSKALDYLKTELRGLRAGRATTALVEYIKIDYYGAATELKAIAAVSVPEPTQLLIKPFDPSSVNTIKHGIEASSLGLNPMVEDKSIRINIPSLSGERRTQLVGQAKKMGEEQKVVMRNARRDANKHADALIKGDDVHISKDEVKILHDEIQDLLKKYEGQADVAIKAKTDEITEI